MRKYILRILSFLIYHSAFSQPEQVNKLSELELKNGSMYLYDQPYTGHAIDFDGTKLDRTKLRFDGHYVNGKPDGIIKKWYPNYKLEYEENYMDGKKRGNQQYFHPNGKLQSEFTYANGNIIDGTYFIYNNSGEKEKQVTYNSGQKIGEGVYKNGSLYETIIEYYSSNIKKAEGINKDGVRDGLWTGWYESGQKNYETNYVNGKENGNSILWYKNGEKNKELVMENGNIKTVIFENNVDPETSIAGKWKQGARLFRCLHEVNSDTLYIMLYFPECSSSGKSYELCQNITSALENRFQQITVSDINQYKNIFLDYLIEIKNAEIKSFYDDGKSVKKTSGITLSMETNPGYRGSTKVLMQIGNLKTNSMVFNDIIQGTSILYNDATTAMSSTPVLIRADVISKCYQAFKIKTQVIEIVERDRKEMAKTISINCGKDLSLAKGFMFNIYDEQNPNNKIGFVKVVEVSDTGAVCKVIEGEEAITQSIASQKKLIAISAYQL